MARVSFSQYSMWSSCPQQYKLSYIDGLSQSTSNIHSVFGTAMHETLQHYLDKCLRISKSQADKMIDLKEYLKERMRETYIKDSAGGTLNVCTKEEMVEFLEDGNVLLDWFQKSKNFNKFFSLKHDELVAIEQPINTKIAEGVNFMGFIDLIVKDTFTGKYRIIDFKTSTAGWSKYQKADAVKNSQILLYKKYYSELFNISLNKIKVEYQIMRRKLPEDSAFPIPYMSKHVPSNGGPSVTKAYDKFMNFVNTVFEDGGTYKDIPFPKVPGTNKKNCKYCEFLGKHCDGKP